MVRTQIDPTEQEHRQLHRLSRRRGTSLSELIRTAIDQWLSRNWSANRMEAMRQACAIWKDRTDLPDFGHLRREWDRSSRT